VFWVYACTQLTTHFQFRIFRFDLLLNTLKVKKMKTVKIILAVIVAAVLSITSYAQMHDHSKMVSTKTVTIKVLGNCESCKARIEKASTIEGVSKADWNPDTQKLTLTYNPSKVTSDDVQKRIAAVGHDTEKYKANDKVYNKLPNCCKYERN